MDLARMAIVLVAPLVPAARRADWRREWAAELGTPRDPGRGVRRRPRRDRISGLDVLGAMLSDAMELRRLASGAGGPPPGRGSPRGGRARLGPLSGLGQDVRHAFRSLRRDPWSTSCSVAVLALGIGAASTIFAVVNRVLLQPLPYADPGRLIMVWESHTGYEGIDFSTSIQGFGDWQLELAGMADLAAYTARPAVIEGGEWPARLNVVGVSADFFTVLGIAPLLGRTLGAADSVPGAADVVLLSHGLWSRRFGADPEIVGRVIRIDGVPREVVGVMGPDFWYFDPYAQGPADLFEPLERFDFTGWDRGDRTLRVVGRLHESANLAAADAALDVLAASIAEQYPETNEGWGIEAVSLHEEVVDDVRSNLVMLQAAVGLVLLIGCLDVANLMIARGTVRRRELALRAALGAGRLWLIRLAVTEASLLALAGACAGLAAALWATKVLAATGSGELALPLADRIGVDPTVAAVGLGTALVAGGLLGALTCGRTSRTDLARPLRGGGRNLTGGKTVRRVRAAIVGGEVALSLILLSGAALLLNSYVRLVTVDPGFDPENVFTFEVLRRPSEADRADGGAGGDGAADDPLPGTDRTAAFFDELLGRLRAQPGITAAGATSHLPFSGWNMTTRFYPAEQPVDDLDALSVAELRRATPGYFETMRLPLLRGRGFGPEDRPGGQQVIVVSAAFVDRFFDGRDALGRRLVLVKGSSLPLDPWEIVGVVADVKHRELGEPDRPVIYIPYAQDVSPGLRIVARTTGDPPTMAAAVRELVAELDPGQPVAELAGLAELVDRSLAVPRFYAATLSLFAASAWLLASIGIGGVVSFWVNRQVREIGVRMALGADEGAVVSWIVRSSMVPVAGGLALGLIGALAATRLLAGFLFSIGPTDPVTLAATVAALGATAWLASWLPARRATRIHPADALRIE